MRAPGGGTPALPEAGSLGGHTARQLLRLCEVVGLGGSDAAAYARVLLEALGPAAERPLDLPPAQPTFLSDDHTPVEFSLSFVPDAAPTLRVLLEPGCGAGTLAHNGRTGLRFLRETARRWAFPTDRLDELEDLFFPAVPEGPLALWCALELRPGGVPRVKAYLNPAARGADRATDTVREALARLGHERAFDSLPGADRHLFFALDLGDWDAPRAKVYLAHQDLSASEAAALSRTVAGPPGEETETFFHIAAGLAPGDEADPGPGERLTRRPVQSCHAFTETATGRPSGFTLHVPVRDYAAHDGEALARATALLGRHGIDDGVLYEATRALTARRPEDGVGLVAYLSAAHQAGHPPRVTTYLSSEAYHVRPPAPSRLGRSAVARTAR
ncbi:tryptophan dimethylallyltransferase family protein [Streptomyces longwoodensis]|uniref:tryptophan dimethylallyltransferase family protein n=1 Tax=Streptomyces longwoodensis TaxID=68231 RepID=UPI002257BED3|nr:tryptophan dimethylallyltransferase family protein [Streptomyces longwoodensis]MCX4996968.1 prenyltransferase [Streptomyces longwoodensis]